MKNLFYVLLLSVVLFVCNKDNPVTNNQNQPNGWAQVYNSNGFLDSMTCTGNFQFCGTNEKLLTSLDLSNSDSVQCQFDYVLSGSLRIFKIYMEQPVGTPHYVLNCSSLPSSNSFVTYNLTIESSKLKGNHYYYFEIGNNVFFMI